jgi:hypothetical protein
LDVLVNTLLKEKRRFFDQFQIHTIDFTLPQCLGASTQESKGKRIGPCILQLRESSKRVPGKLGKARPVDLCQRDRLQQQFARQKHHHPFFD